MVDARNGFFKLQARTKLAKGDGTATVFSAAVAKENSTSVVQVDLEDAGQLFFMFFLNCPQGTPYSHTVSLKRDCVLPNGAFLSINLYPHTQGDTLVYNVGTTTRFRPIYSSSFCERASPYTICVLEIVLL